MHGNIIDPRRASSSAKISSPCPGAGRSQGHLTQILQGEHHSSRITGGVSSKSIGSNSPLKRGPSKRSG